MFIGRTLKLKLQYFGHLMRRTDSFEKTLMLEKIEGTHVELEKATNKTPNPAFSSVAKFPCIPDGGESGDLCRVPQQRWGEGRSLRGPPGRGGERGDLCRVPLAEVGRVVISAGSPGGGGERGLAARSVFEGPAPQLPWEVSLGAEGVPETSRRQLTRGRRQ